ncbi:MAG: RidA family protein [Phycisphaerae bacterium]
MSIHRTIQELGYSLPATAKPVGVYLPAVRSGKLVFTAGQLPIRDGELIAIGKVPTDVSLEAAADAARQAVLNALAAVETVAESVDDIARIVRMNVFVNSAEGFTDQAKLANAASELLGEIFGDAGAHSRCAVGVAELPLNAPVEIDLIVELR